MQRLVAVGLGLGDVVVKLALQGGEIGMHKAKSGIASLDVRGNDTHSADVEHLLETQRFAAHFFNDAVDVLGSTLHQSRNALLVQITLELRPERFHETFSKSPFFVKLARHLLVDIGLQKTKSQVFHFPLELPDTQTVGQRRKDMQGLVRQRDRRCLLARSVMPERLQTRSQSQHHHAQVAGERQQHLAYIFGLLDRVVSWLRLGAGGARLALHINQLVRL